jgi:hypothetical protein
MGSSAIFTAGMVFAHAANNMMLMTQISLFIVVGVP